MQFLVFDIWGDYGHFKRFYTTTSPLTHSFPPPTAVFGMLGAILGVDKREYLRHINLNTLSLSIAIVNLIKKARYGLNLVNTKDNFWVPVKKAYHEPRIQVKTEFLKECRFRIYVCFHNPKWQDKLKENLSAHKTHYTLFLGLASCLANFDYMGEFEAKKEDEKELYIHSVVSMSKFINVSLEQGKKYFKERVPCNMTPDREVTSYEDVIFNPDGQIENPLKLKVKECFLLKNNECIVTF